MRTKEKPAGIIHAAHVVLSHGILLKFPDGRTGLTPWEILWRKKFFSLVFATLLYAGFIQPHTEFIGFRGKNRKKTPLVPFFGEPFKLVVVWGKLSGCYGDNIG